MASPSWSWPRRREHNLYYNRQLCLANAIKTATYMNEYATVYRYQGKYAFQLSGDPRPLVADEILWTDHPRLKHQVAA